MKQSIKHLNIIGLSDFSNALKNHNADYDFEMLFLTAGGTIIGTLEYPLNGKPTLNDYIENSTKDQFNLNAVDYLKHETIDRFKSRDEVAGDTYNLIGDGSLIVIKNAKFYHNIDQPPYLTLNSFALHATDVIGFSLVPSRNLK